MARQQRAWPTHQEWRRRDSLELLRDALRRQDRAIDDVERQRTEPARADMLHVRRLISDVVITLMEAREGEPDELGRALELLRRLRSDDPEVQAFLVRYD